MIADLLQRKDKVSGCFKNKTLLFSSNVKIKFQRKGFRVVLKISLNPLKTGNALL